MRVVSSFNGVGKYYMSFIIRNKSGEAHHNHGLNTPDSSVAMLCKTTEAFAINKNNTSKSDLCNVPRLRQLWCDRKRM